ncbi:MAG: hypothetical protein QOD72_357 [Acidimicrobiaceae bacterium]|jgi:hypothetical protein|nr:hypothetical protein [Acidimicrobiaceae bacterium]
MKVLAAVALLVGVIVPAAAPAAASAPLTGAAGEYFPLAPTRILDTRLGTGGITGPINADAPIDLKVTGKAGVPATGVLSVALNVTVDSPSANGFLTVFPAGATRPDTSTLNFLAGQAAPNLTVVGVSDLGAVTFVITNGIGGKFTGQIIVDIVGWYANSTVTTPGSRLSTVNPQRILDTRRNFGGSGPVGKDGEIEVQIAGKFADVNGAQVNTLDAVVLNLTVAGATSTSFDTVYPADQARPDVSNTNVQAGKDKAALVMVKVPTNGKIHIYNALGSVQFIADVVGFYRGGADPATNAGRVLPLSAPFRAIDSRVTDVRVGTAQTDTWTLDPTLASPGIQPFCPCGGIIMNVTGTDATAPTFLTVFPADPRPDASTVNFASGEAVANLTVAKLAPGTDSAGTAYQSGLKFYNASGFTNYLGDVTAIIQSD